MWQSILWSSRALVFATNPRSALVVASELSAFGLWLCPSGISGSVREGQFIAEGSHATPLMAISTATAIARLGDCAKRCHNVWMSGDDDQFAVG